MAVHRHTAPTPAAVLQFTADLVARPFAVVAGLVFGPNLSPCPVCRTAGTRLGVEDRVGLCYGSCGRVPLARVFDNFFKPRVRVSAFVYPSKVCTTSPVSVSFESRTAVARYARGPRASVLLPE